ncbi:MAG: hypothetical protein L6V81_06780 [Clostridium sp.]|nr:MAG: hypothetical protein L6V81_06780 [Clostridium sp.]
MKYLSIYIIKKKTYKRKKKYFYAYKERWAFNINITSLKRYLEYSVEKW